MTILRIFCVGVFFSVYGLAESADLRSKDSAASSVVLRGHEHIVYSVQISSDSRWIVTGSFDKTARLWDLTAKDPATSSVVLKGHKREVVAVAISPDSRWIVTGSADKTARLWSLDLD